MSSASAERRRAARPAARFLPPLAGIVLLFAAISAASQARDPLETLGTRATTGAAPGYLDDAVCGRCHSERYSTFQAVGMAQSLRAPDTARDIEAFGREYFHEPSQRYYRIDRDDDGRLTFVRYQKDAGGRAVNRLAIGVDWILGSGNRARSYLYQTGHGEIFMLPLSWYAEIGDWRMSPGFEHAAHQGAGRRVTRACLFCHNAYPEVEAQADDHFSPQRFPQQLPQGIGCQRCHGPGAGHVRSVLEGEALQAIRSAIVNPARLPPAARDSVCFQCHLLPAEAVEGVRRLGRGDYSYRPGELLTDYIVNVDVEEARRTDVDRFEINHHGYRLTQSRCYRESAGALTCTTCHDPHVKPASADMRRKASSACTACHEGIAAKHDATTSFREDDCIGCHMPTRRTDDVVEVTMTDHRIARGPFDAEALVQSKERVAQHITGVRIFDFGDPPEGHEATLYTSLAALRAGRDVAGAAERLAEEVAARRPVHYETRIEYARAMLAAGDARAAEAQLRRLLDDRSGRAVTYALLGTALLARGRPTSAVAALERSVGIDRDPETFFNLGAAYLARGDTARAAKAIGTAIELRPLMSIGWRYAGLIHAAAGRAGQAREALERSLAIDPGDSAAYAELIGLLRAQGDIAAARRYLELGRRAARDPARLDDL